MAQAPAQIETGPSPQLLYLQETFRKYYWSTEAKDAINVPSIDSREFGAGFEKKIDFRHKAFPSLSEFHDFLARQGPLYVSYSTARYRYPAAKPMGKKIFLGADLVFDLDKTYESEPHPRSEHNPIICEYCLQRATNDALRFLEEFVFSDFGFSKKDVDVNFSGSKGYHIHIRNESVQHLTADARRQLCDYAAAYEITAFNEDGSGLLKKQPLPATTSTKIIGPSDKFGGWGKKALKWTTSFLQTATAQDLKEMGLRPKGIAELTEKKSWVIEKLSEGNWDVPAGFKDFWILCVNKAISQARVDTDKPVTFDLARLIRVPNTIHGSTGLAAKRTDNLTKFKPLEHAVVLKGDDVSVLPSLTGEVTVGGVTTEFLEGKESSVPFAAAVMLIAKGKARIGSGKG